MPPLVQECLPYVEMPAPSLPALQIVKQPRGDVTVHREKREEGCQDADLSPLVEREPCPCDASASQPYGYRADCILPEACSRIAGTGRQRGMWEGQ